MGSFKKAVDSANSVQLGNQQYDDERKEKKSSNRKLQVTSPPPLECVPLVLAARESMERERESRRSSSKGLEGITATSMTKY